MKTTKFPLDKIDMDQTIQCRAKMDRDVILEYADRMREGDKFPPVVLYGDKVVALLGDGWHRVYAALEIGAVDIEAELRPGFRSDALKHALQSNVAHGHRRTNADKRRCVEVALAEFPTASSRAVAEMCGVSDMLVGEVRNQVQESCTSPRIGKDGKEYPAGRPVSGESGESDGSEKARKPAKDPARSAEMSPEALSRDGVDDDLGGTPGFKGLVAAWKFAGDEDRREFIAWVEDNGGIPKEDA